MFNEKYFPKLKITKTGQYRGPLHKDNETLRIFESYQNDRLLNRPCEHMNCYEMVWSWTGKIEMGKDKNLINLAILL